MFGHGRENAYNNRERSKGGGGPMPTISSCRVDVLVDDETKLIGFIAAVLQISEYELFRIAYRNWHDHPVSETRLDALFKEYLGTGDVPYWVNDFTRKAHEKFLAGELDYRDYGITRRVCDRKTKAVGWVIIFALLVLMLFYSYTIANYTSY
jgi:hypothetical protein